MRPAVVDELKPELGNTQVFPPSAGSILESSSDWGCRVSLRVYQSLFQSLRRQLAGRNDFAGGSTECRMAAT